MRQQCFLAPLLAAFVCGVVGSYALAQDEEAAPEPGVVVEYTYTEEAEAEPAEEAAPAPEVDPFAEPALDAVAVEVEDEAVVGEAAAVEFGIAAPAQAFMQVEMFGGDVADENADPMAPYREMLKAPLKVELSFVKRACKLNDEQRKQVIGAGREWLETYLPKFAKTQQDPNGQMVMVNVGPGNFAQQRRSKKNKQELPELIGQAIGEKLTDEQKKLYQEECEIREAFRRQAIVENIVAIVDDRLRLDAAQREAIAKSLAEHWGEFTPPPLEMFANMSSFNEYMPQLPANCITPHLNENQMREWRRSQSVTMSFGFGVSYETNVIEDIDLNEGLEAEKK